MSSPETILAALLSPRVPAQASQFLEDTRAALASVSSNRAPLTNAFAAVPRRLGKGQPDFTEDERALLAGAGIVLPADLGVDALARVWMLAALAQAAPAEVMLPVVDDCYRHGDNREREAVLRALQIMPAPTRFVPLAVDACRTNVVPVFEAIACDNPYPAAHFPDSHFHQMALKAVFLGLSLSRVVGLDGRLSPELDRMARGYASERRAAGRSVPEDLWRLYLGAQPDKP
jgi:hypothetical protein